MPSGTWPDLANALGRPSDESPPPAAKAPITFSSSLRVPLLIIALISMNQSSFFGELKIKAAQQIDKRQKRDSSIIDFNRLQLKNNSPLPLSNRFPMVQAPKRTKL
jgi:hypothetical protein